MTVTIPANAVRAPKGSQAEQICARALAEVGYREGRNNDTKYAKELASAGGFGSWNYQPWCATFVAWISLVLKIRTLYPQTPSCDRAALWWKGQKRWSTYPAIAAQVLYGRVGDLNHTGLVIAYDKTYIWTVEGNTNDTGAREGNGVYLKQRRRRDANVVMYGYPRLAGGIVSADPAWQPALNPTPQPGTDVPGNRKTPVIQGVDLSHWQTQKLDFTKAYADGVRFVVHKVTDGTTYVDEKHNARRTAVAKVKDMEFGSYHFARPEKSVGAKQAQFFLEHAQPKAGDFRPVLDLEKTGGLSMAKLDAWVEDFVEEVRVRLGVRPILYTNYDLPDTHNCPLWVARYNNANPQPGVPEAWKRWTIWQFSNGVYGRPSSVAGLGHVDINTLNLKVDYNKLLIPAAGK